MLAYKAPVCQKTSEAPQLLAFINHYLACRSVIISIIFCFLSILSLLPYLRQYTLTDVHETYESIYT